MKSLIGILFAILIANAVSAQKPIIEWVNIPAGTFEMGSPKNEVGMKDGEIPHPVTLSAFKMSKYEVTVGQFKAFIDATGYKTDADKDSGALGSIVIIGHDASAKAKAEYKQGTNWACNEEGNVRPATEYNHPVIHVSWNDAKAFADWMGCRLPTEAEWKYACRAGTRTPFNTGNNITTDQSNYKGICPYIKNSKGEFRRKIMPVGSFAPNGWGLYDMHGNVREWCSDWFGYFTKTAQNNPTGPNVGAVRVSRGGSWEDCAENIRSATRVSLVPLGRSCVLGFRLVTSE